jgi:SAM-dependent methyltransferase
MAARRKDRRPDVHTSWDPVAEWYSGWVGESGSKHHQLLALPAVLDLLAPVSGERILDIGAGPGVLAPLIAKLSAQYVGVDASEKLLEFARSHHGRHGRFLCGDAARLSELAQLHGGSFDAAVFVLSIQDMQPLDAVLRSAAWALRPGGRIVILMTHPCFRVPRQSGWGWDDTRRLRYRRVDRYLTELAVPMKGYGTRRKPDGAPAGATRSFHRPLEAYINGLAACGLLIDSMREIPTFQAAPAGPHARAENLAHHEIPLFLGLRATKVV